MVKPPGLAICDELLHRRSPATPALTTSTFGAASINVTGAKSFSGIVADLGHMRQDRQRRVIAHDQAVAVAGAPLRSRRSRRSRCRRRRFSTMAGWPFSVSRWAMMRAARSPMPPAGTLTTILIGCDGESCAAAGAAADAEADGEQRGRRPRPTRGLKIIVFPPDPVSSMSFAAATGGRVTVARTLGTGEARCRARSPAARPAEAERGQAGDGLRHHAGRRPGIVAAEQNLVGRHQRHQRRRALPGWPAGRRHNRAA